MAKLRRHIYVSGRAKSENEQGYYIVDAIHEAIDTRRKSQLIYTDYDVNKKRYMTNDGTPYTVSPYTLEWDGDYYYLRGFCDERQAMRTFRIDRIAEQPKILNQIAVSTPEDYSSAQFSKYVFRMFDTDQPEEVQLQCHISTMKYLIDNFGMDVKTEPIGEDSFRATVLVCTSSTFYRWIFGFNGKIKILGPEAVKTAYREILQKALYEE
nr:WYL domain-containing protein [uncultured Shuttleworthia sp.]